MGATVTFRLPFSTGWLLSCRLTGLPTLLISARYTFVIALVDWPSIEMIQSPSLASTPRSLSGECRFASQRAPFSTRTICT